MKKWLAEFKEFAFKGNILDMSIGVIIGSAFGKIVTSLVNDVLMPLLGLLTGGVNFSSLKLVLSPAVIENGEIIKEEAALLYGSFIQNIVDFLIIALCIFFMLKAIVSISNKIRKQKEEEAAEESPAPSNEEVLLTEIRDLLKEKNS